MKFRLFLLIAALAVIVVIGVSSNSQHQHQIRHAHGIGTLQFFIDGAELTDATREQVTDGTLSQVDFDALKAHFNDSANRHLHKHSHNHNSNHDKVVTQNRFDNVVKNARKTCDFATLVLPAESLVRQRAENNKHRLNKDDSDYGSFAYFKGRIASTSPAAGSLGADVKGWLIDDLQACIDHESHEDHTGVTAEGTPAHSFDYTGSPDKYKNPKHWAVVTDGN